MSPPGTHSILPFSILGDENRNLCCISAIFRPHIIREENHDLCCVFFSILPNLQRVHIHPLDYFTSTCIGSEFHFTNIPSKLRFFKRSELRFSKEESKILKYCAISKFLTLYPNYIGFY